MTEPEARKMKPAALGALLLGATVPEVAGLFYWVQKVDTEPAQVPFGIVLLLIGLLLERVAVFFGMRGIYGPDLPHKKVGLTLVLSAVCETIAWLVWLAVADGVNPYLGLAVLFVLIHFLHCHSLGFFRMGRWSAYLTAPKVILFSAVEALAGHFWLIEVRGDGFFEAAWAGAAILSAGILLEHILEGGFFSKETDPAKMLST